MRFVKFFVVAAFTAALVTLAAFGQPPGGPRGDKGKRGKVQNTHSEMVLDDPKLNDAERKKARGVPITHDDKMREAAEQLRAELLGQMKDLLPAEEFKTFKDELNQISPATHKPAEPANGRR